MRKCRRCKKIGRDRRTLWMACFYQMMELGIPFKHQKLGGDKLYTLIVCKDCRADWLCAIREWFNQGKEERL